MAVMLFIMLMVMNDYGYFLPIFSRELQVNMIETIGAKVFYNIPELLHLYVSDD